MSNETAVHGDDEIARQRLYRTRVVSDMDGTQQGGLAFVISVLSGMIVAATLAPGALTSFWVWFALLMLAVVIALGVQQLFSTATEEEA
ncbi:hypothetical protein [uncultured Tateyamaria sp.]|uniref:hypothetical protein n=1 Tax=Tateyamaria sp. 1078 TaxID=3417464 RepID=UPI00261C0E68|nr:hypothetical protein [uncultured Tateyamaria sp.]